MIDERSDIMSKHITDIKPFTKAEITVVAKIIERADTMGLLSNDRLSLLMDLQVVNNQYPLRLYDMLAASDFDFVHDILGIQKNINRNKLCVDNCFIPRFAKLENTVNDIISQYDLNNEYQFSLCFNELKTQYAIQQGWVDENSPYWDENDKRLYEAECYAYNKIEEYKQELNKDTVNKEDIDI